MLRFNKVPSWDVPMLLSEAKATRVIFSFSLSRPDEIQFSGGDFVGVIEVEDDLNLDIAIGLIESGEWRYADGYEGESIGPEAGHPRIRGIKNHGWWIMERR